MDHLQNNFSRAVCLYFKNSTLGLLVRHVKILDRYNGFYWNRKKILNIRWLRILQISGDAYLKWLVHVNSWWKIKVQRFLSFLMNVFKLITLVSRFFIIFAFWLRAAVSLFSSNMPGEELKTTSKRPSVTECDVREMMPLALRGITGRRSISASLGSGCVRFRGLISRKSGW